MRKRIEVKLVDRNFKEEDTYCYSFGFDTAVPKKDHPRIYYSDCPNIIKHCGKSKMSEEYITDLLDTLVTYFYENDLQSIVVDLEQRNRYLEPAKEMTLDEIEKKLGYKVKIVSDKEESDEN